MEIMGYGEDALTLWAMKNRLRTILKQLRDSTPSASCKVFFRPSFGRGGGARFGEFDFVILADRSVYLGESKWHRSQEKKADGTITLGAPQLARHKMLRFYIEQWAQDNYSSWEEFRQKVKPEFDKHDLPKDLAPSDSLLAENLQTVLNIIKGHCSGPPQVRDVVLYFRHKSSPDPVRVNNPDFQLVLLDQPDGIGDSDFVSL